MALRDLTDPEAIRAAVREFDELGREAFLSRYGFGRSREFVVTVDGRDYDSKAILGAAHGVQHPELGPLGSADFSGGDQATQKLQALGFTVRRLDDAGESSGELLGRFLELYAGAKTDEFRGTHEAALCLKRAAASIAAGLPDGLRGAKVRPSVGQGNWAAVPWIAVLDPRVTTTTQRGVYPVILVRQDLSGLYVTLAQGVTNLKKDLGLKGAYRALDDQARRLHPDLGDLEAVGFSLDSDIDLGESPLGRDYAASTIAWKFYSRDEVATSSLDADLAQLNSTYHELLELGLLTVDDEPEPEPPHEAQVMAIYVGAMAKANFESGGRQGWWGWKEAPSTDGPQIRVGDLAIFGSGYSAGSPRVDAAGWQQHSVEKVIVARVDKVPFRTDEPIMPDEISGEASYPWKLRFTILGEESDVALSWGTALSGAVSEALRSSAINRGHGGVAPVGGSPLLESYLDVTLEELGPPTAEDIGALARGFLQDVGSSGMKVDTDQLLAVLAGLMAKPFAILAGQSGSGKTQIALRLGEWCGENSAGEPRCLIVPVRPDWTGPEFLFGYPDGLAERVAGRTVWSVPDTLQFVLRAHRDPSSPYVLVLDEMNLAHVERYFADFLSGVESRAPVIPNLSQVDGSWVEETAGGALPMPRNLLVIGTVNVDETTYMFSPKVLDRAFVHEFRVASDELDPTLRRPSPIAEAETLVRQQLVRIVEDDGWHFDQPHPEQQLLVDELRTLHQHLARVNLDFGHRVFYEAIRFASIAHACGLDQTDEVLDFIVLTKLLPKVHGSRQRLEITLRVLQGWAVGPGGTVDAPKYPRTTTKVTRMLEVLVQTQFVTFSE